MFGDWFQWIPTALRVAGEIFGGNGDGASAQGQAPPPQPFFTGIGASTLNGYQDFDPTWEGNGNGNGGVFSPPSIPDVSAVLTGVRELFRDVGSLFGDSGNGNGVSGAGGPDIVIPSGDGGQMVRVAAPAGVLALPSIVASAIFQIWSRLRGVTGGTITQSALVAYGARVWAQITGWVQRNPGTSAIALLTGLGLTVDQAAHFLAWGATRKKRRRARGISGRDMKTTRRTMRKVISMAASLRQLCGGATFRRQPSRHYFRGKHHHHA